jgi:hypothetical protein
MNTGVEERVGLEKLATDSPVNSKSRVQRAVYTFDISTKVEKNNIYVVLNSLNPKKGVNSADPKEMVKFSFLDMTPKMKEAAEILKQRLKENYDFAVYIHTMYAGSSRPIISPQEADDLFVEYGLMVSSNL